MADDQEERREIEAYLKQHHLQTFIGDAVNEVVKERPKDPLSKLGDALRACSDASRQIQKVHGRQILNGEALPALEVEIRTGQGPVFAAVSSGPYDDNKEVFEGRGLLQAVEHTDQILAEILLGKDPSHQTKIDKSFTQESTLPANVVSAASIACCKAGAKQNLVAVFDHIGNMCDNSDGRIPATAFSTINGGQSAASSLWVQDIFIVPTGDLVSLSDRLAVASAVHRSLEGTARNAGQEVLQRGPRGGFCNGAGTFEHLVDCLMTSLDTVGHLGRVEFVVDVHASRLVPSSEEGEVVEKDEERTTEYDLTTFSSDTTALELTSAQTLLDTYLEWLEKYPITAFVEPFADTDIAMSKELLIRGNQVLQAKAGASRDPAGSTAAASTGETQADNPGPTRNVEIGGDDSCLLRVIADESVSKPSQLLFVNEQRGANAVVINTSKFSTLSEVITLTTRARDLGWAILVAAVDEHELEGDFLAELGVGMRAEQILLGGLRSASTIAACTRLMRVEDEGVPHVGVGNE
ncbi:unnamed protein product [Ectocarpus sp. CCAP 1310/34]|nr:unnamed protein product [Ectocarpus sp. CCAP 1310/34]